MATYQTYADLNNNSGAASDGVGSTWDACRIEHPAPGAVPALTIDRIVTLAKAGANTSPGDTVVINVWSTEVRTAQTITPDGSVSGVNFTIKPWGTKCAGNAGGRFFVKGPDAGQIALVQPSGIGGVQCTLTIGNPGLLTVNPSNMVAGVRVNFALSGGAPSLPTEIVAGASYYVRPTGVANQYWVYATLADALADTNRLIFTGVSAPTQWCAPDVSLIWQYLNVTKGANTSRCVHRDGSTSAALRVRFEDSIVDMSAGNVGIFDGPGTAGPYIIEWARSAFTLADAVFLAGACGATEVRDGGLGDTSSITQNSLAFMAFSATRKLDVYDIRGTQFVTGALGTSHAITFEGVAGALAHNASLIRHENSDIRATQGTGSSLFYLPDSGTAACELSIKNNTLVFTGAGSNGGAVVIGRITRPDTGLYDLKKTTWELMNHNFSSITIDNNYIRNTNDAGSVLTVDIGADRALIQNNLLCGGVNAHCFRVSGNDATIQYNVSIGSLAMFIPGNGVTCRHNLVIAPEGFALLIGSPGGTGWEHTGYWGKIGGVEQPDDGGEITDNMFVTFRDSPAASDYSDSGGSWPVLTVFDRNQYCSFNHAALYINGGDRATIAAAQAAWAAAPISLPDNDASSQIVTLAQLLEGSVANLDPGVNKVAAGTNYRHLMYDLVGSLVTTTARRKIVGGAPGVIGSF